MGLFGKTNNTINTELFGYHVQTSLYGTPIRIVYGAVRAPGNVIWTGDWRPIPVSGGKKGGGGKKAGAGQTFDYHSAIAIAICQGPVQGIGYLWVNQTRFSLNTSTELFQIPTGGGSYTVVQSGLIVFDYGTGVQNFFSITADDFGSPGPTVVSGDQVIPLVQVTGPPGPGQYSVDLSTGTYHFNAADVGLIVEIVYGWRDPNTSVDGNPIQDIGLALLNGTQSQPPWSYLTTNHPNQALGYTSVAYLTSPDLDLGVSGAVSNYNFEIFGFLPFGSGVVDANPADIIPDFLTNPLYGVGFPAENIGDLTEISTYCLANSYFISENIESAKSADSWLADWVLIANAEAVWSDGLLKFRCYGDKTAVGNGAVFTPTTSPIYDLDSDDFLANQGEEPVKVDRPTVRDCYNQIWVEWTNRGNSYTVQTIDEKDDWAISQFKLRPASPKQLHGITSQLVAQKVCNTILQRSVYIRNTYKFKVSSVKYALLEPMDMVTLTKEEQGLFQTPVRIKSIQENEKLEFEIEAEEFPWGTATPTRFPKQHIGPFGPEYFQPPGPINPPIFFEATEEMTRDALFTLLIGLSGGPEWGGCNIHVSADNGNSYNFIGRQSLISTMGTLTAALPYGPDPDTINTLSIDLTESFGAVSSVSRQEVDKFKSLVLVDDELIAYQTATLTGAYEYDLTYLRRGVYGTPPVAHDVLAPFVVADDGMFAWEYDPVYIGRLLYFKFTSFNRAGLVEEDISKVTAYPYFIKAPRTPYCWQPQDLQSTVNHPFGILLTDRQQKSFLISQDFTYDVASFVTPTFKAQGDGPIDVFSQVVNAPHIISIVVDPLGGTITGGQTITIGVCEIDTDRRTSPLRLSSIDVPLGSDTNRLLITVSASGSDFFLNHDFYFSNDPSKGWEVQGELQIDSEDSETITYVATVFTTNTLDQAVNSAINIPDELFHHFVLQARVEFVPGIGAATVLAVTPTTIQLDVAASLPDVSGRTATLFAKADVTQVLPLFNLPILSNTNDTLTFAPVSTAHLGQVTVDITGLIVTLASGIAFELSYIGGPILINGITAIVADVTRPGPFFSYNTIILATAVPYAPTPVPYGIPGTVGVDLSVGVGDTIVIRTKADSFSSTFIGDSKLMNSSLSGGTMPAGMVPGAFVGKTLLITHGNGLGTAAQLIVGNSATGFNVVNFPITPDATTEFVVIDALPDFSAPSSQMLWDGSAVLAPTGPANYFSFRLAVDNVWRFYLVQAFTAGANGNLSSPYGSPYREIFQSGFPQAHQPNNNANNFGVANERWVIGYGPGGTAANIPLSTSSVTGTSEELVEMQPGQFYGWDARAEVAPTGSDLVFDILLNGVSIFGPLLTDKIVIPAGSTDIQTGTNFLATNNVINVRDKLKLVVVQIGSSFPGQRAVVNLYWKINAITAPTQLN